MSQFGGANPAFFGAPVVPVDPVSAGARQSISNTSDNAVRQEQIQAQASAEAARLRLQQEEMKNRARLEELGLKADKARLDLDREMGERQLKLRENQLEQERIEAEERQKLSQQQEERLSKQGDRQLDLQERSSKMQEAELRLRFMEEGAGGMAQAEAQASRRLGELARERELTAKEYAAKREEIQTDRMEQESELAADAAAKAKRLTGTLSSLGSELVSLRQSRDALIAADEEATDRILEAVPKVINDFLVSLQDQLLVVGVGEFLSRVVDNTARSIGGFLIGSGQTPTGEDFLSSHTRAMETNRDLNIGVVRIPGRPNTGANDEFVPIVGSSLLVPRDLLPDQIAAQITGSLEASGFEGMRERFSGVGDGLARLGARGFDVMAGEGRRMTEEDAMAVLDEMTGGGGAELLASDPDSVRYLLRSFVLAGRNLEDQSEVIEEGPGYVKTGVERLGRAYARGAQEMLDVLDLGLDESRAVDAFLTRYQQKMEEGFSDPEQAPILVRRLRDEMEQLVEEGESLRPEEVEVIDRMLSLAEEAMNYSDTAEDIEGQRRNFRIESSRRIDELRQQEIDEIRVMNQFAEEEIDNLRENASEQFRENVAEVFEAMGLDD